MLFSAVSITNEIYHRIVDGASSHIICYKAKADNDKENRMTQCITNTFNLC